MRFQSCQCRCFEGQEIEFLVVTADNVQMIQSEWCLVVKHQQNKQYTENFILKHLICGVWLFYCIPILRFLSS